MPVALSEFRRNAVLVQNSPKLRAQSWHSGAAIIRKNGEANSKIFHTPRGKTLLSGMWWSKLNVSSVWAIQVRRWSKVYSIWEVWIWINMDANVWSFGAVFFVSNHSKWRCMMKEPVNGPVKSKMMKTSGSIWERRHHRMFAIVSVVCFLRFRGVEELFQFTWQEDTDQKKPKKEKKTTKVGWKVEANERVFWLSASLERIMVIPLRADCWAVPRS